MVLMVAQIAFLLSTFKYVVAVLLGPGSVLKGDDIAFMGVLMVLMDVTFMMASGSSALIVVYLLRAKVKSTVQKPTQVRPVSGKRESKELPPPAPMELKNWSVAGEEKGSPVVERGQ